MCCPTGFEHAVYAETTPQDSPQDGEEPGEGALPPGSVCDETEQYIGQQRGPDLPPHRMFVVPQEIGELEGLLDLLEEHFDSPTGLVKIAD